MRALCAALAAILLASCARSQGDAPPPRPATPAGVVCRIGPDGGPVLADRGIGGTGAPAQITRTAERGIGGTGAPILADRGIGGTGGPGTGIVGVITGFASICVGGREVGFAFADPIEVDGRPDAGTSLRAGQVAAIEAAGPALRARRVAVRHEVSGPMEAVEAPGVLRVAGQRVVLTDDTLGDAAPAPGEWIAVSGLRDAAGAVVATRLDRRAAGLVVVHGVLLPSPDGPRIGALRLVPLASMEALPGQYVTAFGRYADGVLRAESVVADVLAMSPDAYFGPAVGTFVIESFAAVGDGRAGFGRGAGAALPGLFAPGTRRVLVEYQRREGGIVATRLGDPPVPLRFSPGRDAAPTRGPRFEPAPVPNRDSRFGGPRRESGMQGPGNLGRGQGRRAQPTPDIESQGAPASGRDDRGPLGGVGGGRMR